MKGMTLRQEWRIVEGKKKGTCRAGNEGGGHYAGMGKRNSCLVLLGTLTKRREDRFRKDKSRKRGGIR